MLTEKQIRVLELDARGMSKKDIIQSTGLNRSTVDYALKKGKKNIETMIDNFEHLVKNQLLDKEQTIRLKSLLDYF